jgi:hypothetical protein
MAQSYAVLFSRVVPTPYLDTLCAHRWFAARDPEGDLLLVCSRCGGWKNWSLARRHKDEQGEKVGRRRRRKKL